MYAIRSYYASPECGAERATRDRARDPHAERERTRILLAGSATDELALVLSMERLGAAVDRSATSVMGAKLPAGTPASRLAVEAGQQLSYNFV